MKKFIIPSLIAVAVLSLTGCGTDQAAHSTTTTTQQTTIPAPVTTTTTDTTQSK